MAYADQVAGSRHLSIIAGVAAVHGMLGYLFVSGMAVDIVTKFVPVLTTTNVPVELPPPPDVPPPPASKTSAQPVTTVPVAPVAPIEAPASTFVVTIDPGPPSAMADAGTEVATEPPSPPVPSLAAGPRVSGDRLRWFTTDDYPPSALRAEEEGTVAVRLSIAADGRVAGCTVTAGSGSSALDQATCRLYERRGRFTPARDAGGTAVAATYTDRVRWQLPPR